VTAEPGVALSPEQTHVLSMVKSGGNVFFTGSAGRFHGNSGGFFNISCRRNGQVRVIEADHRLGSLASQG